MIVTFLTVYSFTMDFVLVLILAFLSTGQSYIEVTEQKCEKCHVLCPPGSYKVGECDDPVAKYRCEECNNTSFTAIANYIQKCERCSTCGHYEKPIKNCTRNSNVVCDCMEGYYHKKRSSHDSRVCRECKCESCEKLYQYPDYRRKCQPCQRCLECKRKCPGTSFPPSTNSYTAASISPATRITASTNASTPVMKPLLPNLNEMSWLFLVVVLVTLLLFLWLLLLFARSPFRYPNNCLYWSVNKDLEPPLEDPDFSEQSSHQGSSSNTLTLNISENTPIMTLSHQSSPAMTEHLTHISPQDDEHKATRQHVQSDHWPAIVLYAIIKEVPLRRWKEFLRLLSLTDQQLERVELEAGLGLGSMERQYQMLRLWSQSSSVSLKDVFSALHYMDLSGCAQLLQESLEKLQFPGLN